MGGAHRSQLMSDPEEEEQQSSPDKPADRDHGMQSPPTHLDVFPIRA